MLATVHIGSDEFMFGSVKQGLAFLKKEAKDAVLETAGSPLYRLCNGVLYYYDGDSLKKFEEAFPS